MSHSSWVYCQHAAVPGTPLEGAVTFFSCLLPGCVDRPQRAPLHCCNWCRGWGCPISLLADLAWKGAQSWARQAAVCSLHPQFKCNGAEAQRASPMLCCPLPKRAGMFCTGGGWVKIYSICQGMGMRRTRSAYRIRAEYVHLIRFTHEH